MSDNHPLVHESVRRQLAATAGAFGFLTFTQCGERPER
jgi:hypothetical protein